MISVRELHQYLNEPSLNQSITKIWELLGENFKQAQAALPAEFSMRQTQISFHEQVKLLGYLCCLISETEGDIVEIGVWKGKSLALMNEICNRERRIIGIDPMKQPHQLEEISFYKNLLFPNAILLTNYSELCYEKFTELSPKIALLHIDGGHAGRNVLLDFLLYAPHVVKGGMIVFDDYADFRSCPEVGKAVDLLRVGGFFDDFNIIGPVEKFYNSYLLQKR